MTLAHVVQSNPFVAIKLDCRLQYGCPSLRPFGMARGNGLGFQWEAERMVNAELFAPQSETYRDCGQSGVGQGSGWNCLK